MSESEFTIRYLCRLIYLFGIALSRPLAVNKCNGLTVSTIWDDEGAIYETLIIDSRGAYPVERYKEIELASAGHQAWVDEAASMSVVNKLGCWPISHDELVTLARFS